MKLHVRQVRLSCHLFDVYERTTGKYITVFIVFQVLWCVNYGWRLTLYVDEWYVLVSRLG